MTRTTAQLLLACISIVAMGGCCLRQNCETASCPPYDSRRSDIPTTPKPSDSGVVYDFGNIGRYGEIQRSILESVASEPTVLIDLSEAICMAARNSELADMIEAERHALRCEADDCNGRALDIILQGEALEQRNLAAGAAAELFLGMVQINMQRALVEEAKVHLSNLAETIRAARAAGFATAEGKMALAKGQIDLMLSEAQLNAAEQEIMIQFGLLVQVNSKFPVIYQPVYELVPTYSAIDFVPQTEIAMTNRPGIRAIELTGWDGAGAGPAAQMLGLFDSRLGLTTKGLDLKKRFLRKQVMEFLAQNRASTSARANRNQQISQVLAARKKQARVEASDALLKIQSTFEKLAIANQNVERLETKRQQLNAKRELKTEDAYIALNRNFSESQTAKSERIAAAIKYETAKIRLLQAQGVLAQRCGYDFTSECTDRTGFGFDAAQHPTPTTSQN